MKKEKYVKNNLVIEDDQYIIFNKDTCRIFGAHKDADLDNELEKINEKCKDGVILRNNSKGKSFRNIVISCSETCNLCCTYCFAGAGQYGNKSAKKMLNETDFEKLISLIIEHKDEVRSLCFFGGEPLLNIDEIEKFLIKLIAFYKENNLRMPRLGMITNGTLLNENVVSIANKYDISISISLDVNQEMNDACRFFPDKHESVFNLVINNIKKIKERKFLLTIVSTISRKNILKYKKGDYAALIKFYKNVGIDAVECVVADENEEVTDEEKEKIELLAADEISFIFEKIMKNEDMEILSRTPMGAIYSIVKKKYYMECPVGEKIFYYNVNGEIYPCQMYYAAGRKEVHEVSRKEHPQCQECFCQNICAFFCNGSNIMVNGTEKELVETRCIFSRALYSECIRQLYKYMNSSTNDEIRGKFVENLIKYSKLYKRFV